MAAKGKTTSLEELASSQVRRDQAPNQDLAQKLVAASERGDVSGDIRLLVENLSAKQKALRHDCIKVLYEIGYRKAQLIERYVDDFVALLGGRDNRMEWGVMIALGTIAPLQAPAIWPHMDAILAATRNGSAITQDGGVRVLAALAAADPAYAKRAWPFLIDFLKSCRFKDVASHAESVAPAALGEPERRELGEVLTARRCNLKPAAQKRLDKLLKQLARG